MEPFHLSSTAAHTLWGLLDLGRPPFPFRFGAGPRTAVDRRDDMAELVSLGLVARGRPVDGVRDALTVLSTSTRAVSAAVRLGSGRAPLLVRAGATGDVGVLAVQRAGSVRLDAVRPTGVVRALVDVVPDARPIRAAALTFPHDAAVPVASGGYLEPVHRPGTGHELSRQRAALLWRRPRRRVGVGYAHVREGGRERDSLPLSWFDTDDGRFAVRIAEGPDGHLWESYYPADNKKLASQLAELLD